MAYTSDLPKGKIEFEKKVTAEEVVAEANKIFHKVKKQDYNLSDPLAIESMLGKIRTEHPQIAQSYPIVLRYMCQFGQYHPKAFAKYLRRIAAKMYQNEDQYLDSQADYAVLLYRHTHNHYSSKDLQNVWRNIRAELEREKKDFKTKLEVSQKEVEADEVAAKSKNLAEIVDNIRNLKDDIFLEDRIEFVDN